MQFCPGAEHLKVKKPVYVREIGTRLYSTAIIIHPCSCFHFIVNEISRNEMKNCPSRLTAVNSYNDVPSLLQVERSGYKITVKVEC